MAEQELTLADVFEAQVDQAPDRGAAEAADGVLTYRELDEAANWFAHRLLAGGVAPGQRVLCGFTRSCAALVAQLAVYKAGAVYVPVDPSVPPERLRLLAARTQAAAVLSTVADFHRMADLAPVAQAVDLSVRDSIRPRRQTSPSDVAYLVFTSGSTGEPKGVLVSHRAIVSTTLARFAFYDTPVRRFLLLWQLAFDAAVGCMWWTLASGGAIEFAPADLDGMMASVDAMLDGSKQISHTAITPSHYYSALQHAAAVAGGPDVVVVAGETCPPQLIDEHHRLLPDTRLYNEYGPTEAAVWCTGAELLPGQDVNAGRAIRGAEVLVLDADARPVPVGAVGEIHIAGAGLALGYLDDPELTARKFVEYAQGRCYRTGDLGRLRADGSLVVLGRTDDQLKIRGHRIEPGEVEAVLQAHPTVAQAVVTQWQGKLVAYVVRPARESEWIS